MSKWQRIRLGEILPVSIPGEWGNEPNGIRDVIVLRAADFTKDCKLRTTIGVERSIPLQKLATRVLKYGDILIEKSGGSPDQPVGRAVFFDRKELEQVYSFSNFLQMIRVSDNFDKKFVHYLLSFLYSSGRVYKYQQQTTGIINFKLEDYLREEVNIPVVDKEQCKIAKILFLVDQAIEKTEALIHKYQQIKAGLMHDLFTRGLTADGKLRPPRKQAPELYQETPIGWIPKEWDIKTLRQLVGAENIVNGPFGSDLLTSELRAEGVPVLYVQDIKPGWFRRISKAHVTKLKAAQLSFCNVRKKDILVAKVGAPPCDSCVYPSDKIAIVTQDVIRIRPIANVDSEYIASLLNAPFGRKSIRKISIEGTRERVSLTDFKRLLVPVALYQEQRAIREILRLVQTLIDKEEIRNDKFKKQKSGLMHDLLTGKVQVTIDKAETANV